VALVLDVKKVSQNLSICWVLGYEKDLELARQGTTSLLDLFCLIF
jgi:hypothetical protein